MAGTSNPIPFPAPAAPTFEPIVGALVGRVVSVDEHGVALVEHPRRLGEGGIPAVSNIELGPDDVGAPVTLLFEEGDPSRPIILARVWTRPKPKPNTAAHGRQHPVTVSVDGQRVSVCGDREIVLRCGKASITLTQAGKLILRGTYILQASSGANKIKGASVQIN